MTRICYDGQLCEEGDITCSECSWTEQLQDDSATKAVEVGD